MIQKEIPMPIFSNEGLLSLLLNRIDELNKCFPSLGKRQEDYLKCLFLYVSENASKNICLSEISKDDIRLYASILAYYITADCNTTESSIRCCLNDELIEDMDAPNSSDKLFGEIVCETISKYCKETKKALISFNNAGGWLTSEARLYLNLERPKLKGELACLYIPIITRATEMFLAYFDENELYSQSKTEITLLCMGILSSFKKEDTSIRFSGLPILLERLTSLLIYENDIKELDKEKLIEFERSIIYNTPGMCEDYSISTQELSSYFNRCVKLHMKEGDTNGTIKWIEPEYPTYNYGAYRRLYLSKELYNYTFEDLFNERNSLYVNDHRDIFKRNNDDNQYAYIENYDAVKKSAYEFITDYICEKSQLYRTLYLRLITSNDIEQKKILNIFNQCIFESPLSRELCWSSPEEYLSDEYDSGFDTTIEKGKEIRNVVLAIGRYINKQKNETNLGMFGYNERWTELSEAFDF